MQRAIKPHASALALVIVGAALALPAMAQQPPQRGGARGQHGSAPTWWDGAHGHSRSYPRPGWRVHAPPAHSRLFIWAGINYSFFDGVWYAPGPGGYAVVRPPIGIVVDVLPPFRTALVIGGLTYYYANGVYYRDRPEGGYEVVPTPVGSGAAVLGSGKLFVYPRLNQNVQQQASDEYECHKWAAGQSGFDPAAAATGQAVQSNGRADYSRAQTACLEGRGYTVR
jgi:hypothetical protein